MNQKKGFARLSPEKRREIASMGGKAVQRAGKGHRFTTLEAKEAGRRGGLEVSKDREYMRTIGARGGRGVKSRMDQRREMVCLEDEFNNDSENKKEME